MKKFLSLILTLGILLGCTPFTAFASNSEVTTAITTAQTLVCQENLKVNFTKPGNLNGITAFQFKLYLPDGFSIKSAKSLLSENWELYYSENTGRFLLYSINLSSLEETATATDGIYSLLELELELDAIVQNGEYTATIVVEDIASQNFTANKGTGTFYSTFSYFDHEYIDGSCRVCGTTQKHTVTFFDKMGNVVYTTFVEDGKAIPDDDINKATDLLPEIYGYKKATDSKGLQAFNGDITQAIYSDVEFIALYNKLDDRYTVTINYTDGKTRNYSYRFNEKIVITDNLANYWVLADNPDVIVAVANDGVSEYYVSGEAVLEPKTDTAPNEKSITFVRKVTGTQNGKRTYTVFAHAINIAKNEIESCGVSFMSNAQYTALSKRADVTKVLWKDQTFTKEESTSATAVNYVIGGRVSADFLVTLTNISATKAQMRWAQGWIVLKDGTTIITETPVSELFPAVE